MYMTSWSSKTPASSSIQARGLNIACRGELRLRNAYIGDNGGDMLDEDGTPSWFDASSVQITTAGQTDEDSRPWMIAGDSLVKG